MELILANISLYVLSLEQLVNRLGWKTVNGPRSPTESHGKEEIWTLAPQAPGTLIPET